MLSGTHTVPNSHRKSHIFRDSGLGVVYHSLGIPITYFPFLKNSHHPKSHTKSQLIQKLTKSIFPSHGFFSPKNFSMYKSHGSPGHISQLLSTTTRAPRVASNKGIAKEPETVGETTTTTTTGAPLVTCTRLDGFFCS